MGKDRRFMFSPQQLNSLSLNPYPLVSLSHSRQLETIISSKTGGVDMNSANGVLPVRTHPSDSYVWPKNDNVWFSHSPGFQQAFTPSQDPRLKEICPVRPCEFRAENFMPKAGAECAQKRFLVFDQSGDKTTLVFSSGEKPLWLPTSWSSKPPKTYDVNSDILRTKEELNFNPGLTIPSEEFDENDGTDGKSEMHEDTEELNALLYSEDESDYSDDEVSSSGHSPSSVSSHVDQEASVGSTQGIGTFGQNKKRKIQDGRVNDGTLSPLVKENKLNSKDKNDAEASCANGYNSGSIEFSSSSYTKRVKKEKICETVSILRSMVPDGEGADAVVVLDKAIDYLMTLKLEAKTLGLDSL